MRLRKIARSHKRNEGTVRDNRGDKRLLETNTGRYLVINSDDKRKAQTIIDHYTTSCRLKPASRKPRQDLLL